MASYAMRGLQAVGVDPVLHCRKPGWARLWSGENVRPFALIGRELNGNDNELRTRHHPNFGPDKPTRPRFYLENAGFPGVEPVRPPIDDLPGDDRRGAGRVLMFPFTTHPNRDWTPINWVHLARILGARIGPGRLMTISRDKRPELDWFQGVTFWHGLSLKELIGFIRASDLVISNDSGPAHIAAALGANALVVHAQVDPADLYGEYRSPGVTVAAPLPGMCSPCNWQPRARGVLGYQPAICNASCFALQSVPPMFVAEIAAGLLETGPPPSLDIRRPG